jgi:uncharacterized protein (DUF1697 family)
MDSLRELYNSLGFINVKTYIQSGNVIFDSPVANSAELIQKIEEGIQSSFGFSVNMFIRTRNELKEVIENNPFASDSFKDKSKLYVTFLSQNPSEELIRTIRNSMSGSEELTFSGREIYLHYPDGYGKTKFDNNFFERKLRIPATTRNWKTVNMLYELAVGQ